jgi:hypothetical protein
MFDLQKTESKSESNLLQKKKKKEYKRRVCPIKTCGTVV